MYTQCTIAIVCTLSLQAVPIFLPWFFSCCLLRSVSYHTTFTLTCMLTNACDTRYMCASCATLDPRKNQRVRRAIQRKQAQKASSGNSHENYRYTCRDCRKGEEHEASY